MDFFSGLHFWGGSALGSVLPFLFVLTVVVFFHELGHFWVARRCGVKIDAFSVGFGPELFGFFDRHGTRWRIAAIPLGGYVRFHGDDSAASTPDLATLDRMSARSRNARRSSRRARSRIFCSRSRFLPAFSSYSASRIVPPAFIPSRRIAPRQ